MSTPQVSYRNMADMALAIHQNLSSFPDDIDLVAGIPRSGILAAGIFALDRGIPLTDLEGLMEGRLFNSGSRLQVDRPDDVIAQARRILVLDDSVFSGRALSTARNSIDPSALGAKVSYGAVFVVPKAVDLVDFYCEVVNPPRVFAWNTMTHSVLGRACVDIDGVLCDDPTPAENDDGPRYLDFLENARARSLPTRPVAHLVTSRLEKYRGPTQRWLADNGVEYDHLHMLDLPDAASRRASRAHAPFKADVYRRTGAILFIESDPLQAREIARLSGKPVVCNSNQFMYPGESRPRQMARVPRRVSRGVVRRARRVQPRLARYFRSS